MQQRCAVAVLAGRQAGLYTWPAPGVEALGLAALHGQLDNADVRSFRII